MPNLTGRTDARAPLQPRPVSPGISRTVSQLTARQRLARQRAFAQAKEKKATSARASGAYVLGRDERGAATDTRTPEGLGITVDQWHVNLRFWREDIQRLEGQPVDKIEGVVKSGRVPRVSVRMATHIITAVRLLSHVRENYEREMGETEALLQALAQLNVQAAQARKMQAWEIGQLAAQLKEFWQSVLARKQVAVKKIVARTRLEQAIQKLEEAAALPEGERALALGAALAILTSVRARLGQWRDRQIAGLAGHNYQKECALRIKRDEWLLSQFARMAEMPEKIFEYQKKDEIRLAILGRLRRLMELRLPARYLLPIISSVADEFRVPERNRKGAGANILAMEAGKGRPLPAMKLDYLIGHYGWLYRYVRDGERAKAMAKLDELALFVMANKPAFILDELSKTNDPYLAAAVRSLGEGVEAHEARNFQLAKACFGDAREAMRHLVHPKAGE